MRTSVSDFSDCKFILYLTLHTASNPSQPHFYKGFLHVPLHQEYSLAGLVQQPLAKGVGEHAHGSPTADDVWHISSS